MTGRFTEGEDGAPREPRFFARGAWLAAIPLAWAASLALVVAMQGFSGTFTEARGPAHYHVHDGDHAHDAVAHHHHGPEAGAVLVEEDKPASDDARTVFGGFDTVPARAFSFALLPARMPPPAASAHPAALPPLSRPERPPAA